MLKNRVVILLALLILSVLPLAHAGAQTPSIMESAAANPELSTFVTVLETAGITWPDGPLTVFAPNNAAFAALPPFVLEYLLAQPELLTAVLHHHIIAGNALLAADVTAGDLASAQGSSLTFKLTDTGFEVDGAQVVTADSIASDGVVHVVDAVLLPDIVLPEHSALEFEGEIIADGSSTVEPIALALADLFTEEGFGGNISVGESGTGGGFKAFCEEGVTDLSNASRPIKHSKEAGEAEEYEKCLAIGREPLGFRIGTDGLTIAVNPANDFATDLTLEEIQALFSTATKWSDVRAGFPAEDIIRYIPGTDSGTFDYFVEVTFAKDDAPLLAASKLNMSENDNVLVQGVGSNKYAVGFFGYAYYTANAAALKAVAVNGVLPNAETVDAGTYKYARPLFIYSTAALMQEKPQVAGFLNFALTRLPEVLPVVGYFPASSPADNEAKLLWLAAVG